MRKYIIFTLLILLSSFSAINAQTIDQARALFTQKKYEEAKPIFEQQLKRYPNNANYNYWYGVSAFETGEFDKAIKPLNFAHRRKVADATLYLSKAYIHAYQFDEAEKVLNEFIKIEKRRRKNTSEAENLLEIAKQNTRLLRGLEQVIVIDSIVVPKIDFLSAIHSSKESGNLSYLTPNSKDSLEFRPVIFEPERGNVRYSSKKTPKGFYQLFQQNLIGDSNWSQSQVITGLGISDSVNITYPFVLNDGVTTYFATDDNKQAKTTDYNIMVTRFNSSNGSYLIPANIGMPFNSISNDYMYVIDEYNDLGCFVSDRFQPAEKVCVYVFIPNKVKRTYNYESEPRDKLIALAQLRDIKLTWTDTIAVQDGLKRLDNLKEYQPDKNNDKKFHFVINDTYTYDSLDDFKTEKGKEEFLKYQMMLNDFDQLQTKIKTLRKSFEEGDQSVRSAILELEKHTDVMRTNIHLQEKTIRKVELNNR